MSDLPDHTLPENEGAIAPNGPVTANRGQLGFFTVIAIVGVISLLGAALAMFAARATQKSSYSVNATLVKTRHLRPDGGVALLVAEMPRSAVYNIPRSKEFLDRVGTGLEKREITISQEELRDAIQFSTDPKDTGDTYVIIVQARAATAEASVAIIEEAIRVYREMFEVLWRRPTLVVRDYYVKRLESLGTERETVATNLAKAKGAISPTNQLLTLDLQTSLKSVLDNWSLARRRRIEVEAGLLRAREELAVFSIRASEVNAAKSSLAPNYTIPQLPAALMARMTAVENAVLDAERESSAAWGPGHPGRQELERLYALREELRLLAAEFSQPLAEPADPRADTLQTGTQLAANQAAALVQGLERELSIWTAFEASEQQAAARFAAQYEGVQVTEGLLRRLETEIATVSHAVQACDDALATPIIDLMVSQSPSSPELVKGISPVMAAFLGLFLGAVLALFSTTAFNRSRRQA